MRIRLFAYLACGSWILRQKNRRLQDGGDSQTWWLHQKHFFISQQLNVQLSSKVQKKVTMVRPRQCSTLKVIFESIALKSTMKLWSHYVINNINLILIRELFCMKLFRKKSENNLMWYIISHYATFIKLSFQNSLLTNCIYKHVNENVISYGWKYYASWSFTAWIRSYFHILL